jgi:hypothetical protein
MDNAFLFDENSTGICSEEDYPYSMHRRWIRGCGSENGECTPVEHTRVKSFVDVENSADALVEAISKQPVSVAMYVLLNGTTFTYAYSSVGFLMCYNKDGTHLVLLNLSLLFLP